MPGDVRSRRAAPGADADPESPHDEDDDDDDQRTARSNRTRLAVAFVAATLLLWFGLDCWLSPPAEPLSTVPPVRPHIELESPQEHADEVEQGNRAMHNIAELAQELDEEKHPEHYHAPKATGGPVPETAAPAPRALATLAPRAPPLEWRRHALQQEAGLPAGPQHPGAPEPPSSSKKMVKCETTTGPVTIEVSPDWAPHGAKRFLDMVQGGFFSSKVTLFRSVKGWICQTGIAGDPKVHQEWKAKGNIPDDPQWLDQKDSNRMKRGYLSFAGGGSNSRGTEFFFAYKDLGLGTAGSPWEVPFGKVVGEESFQNMDHWYTGYGELRVFGGKSPEQGKIYQDGIKYVEAEFPDIDYITACAVLEDELRA